MRLDAWKNNYPLAEMLAEMAELDWIDGYCGRFVARIESEKLAEEITNSMKKVLDQIREELDVNLELYINQNKLWIVIEPAELERHGYVDEGKVDKKIRQLWDWYSEAVENDGYVPEIERFYEDCSDEIDEYVYDNVYLNPSVEEAFAIAEEEIKSLLQKNS